MLDMVSDIVQDMIYIGLNFIISTQIIKEDS